MELNPGIRDRETPLHAHAALVPLLLTGPGHPLHLLPALDSGPQGLPRQDAQFDFRHVQPTAVLRRVVPPDPLSDLSGLFGLGTTQSKGEIL
jgi:hypothetical protein